MLVPLEAAFDKPEPSRRPPHRTQASRWYANVLLGQVGQPAELDQQPCKFQPVVDFRRGTIGPPGLLVRLLTRLCGPLRPCFRDAGQVDLARANGGSLPIDGIDLSAPK